MKQQSISNSTTIESETKSLLEKTLQNTINCSDNKLEQKAQGLFVGKIQQLHKESTIVELLDTQEQIEVKLALCSLPKEALNSLCVIQLTQSNPAQPIIMGLLNQQQNTSLLAKTQAIAFSENENLITLNLKKDMMIRCGNAYLYLSTDGTVQIRGDYIDLQAKATQTIKGGSVRIN